MLSSERVAVTLLPLRILCNARQHFGVRERSGIVDIRAQLAFGAIRKAVEVGVLVKTKQRHRTGCGRCILEAFAAVAQPVGVDIPPVGGRERVLTPNGFARLVRRAARRLAPARRVAAIFGRPDRDDRAVGVGFVGEVAGEDVKYGFLAPGGDQVGVDSFVAVGCAVFEGDLNAGIGSVLVKEFVDTVGEVFDHDTDRLAQVHIAHLVRLSGMRREV